MTFCLSGKEFMCWKQTAFRDMLDQIAPASVVLCIFCLLRCGLALPSKPLLVTCWIKTALRDMLDQNCSRQCCSLHFLSACDAGLLLPLHYRQCVDAVSLALAEKLVLELFHCVKLSVYGLPLWNSHGGDGITNPCL